MSIRQRAILEALAAGRVNKEIAAAMSLNTHTIKYHIIRLFAEFDVKSRTRCELIAKAFRAGVLK